MNAAPVNIMIATPCYGGMVHVEYLRSLLRLSDALSQRSIAWQLFTRSQESLISRARNSLVAEFLGRSAYSHLLFADADIGFGPDAILRLLDRDKPVTACAYPMKGIDWGKVGSAARAGADRESLARAGLTFALNVSGDRREASSEVEVINGFVRVVEAGTGLMLIRRDAFDALRATFPDLQYENDVAGYDNPHTRGNFWLFFETMKHPTTGRYLSEDFAFCYRWTQGCGGEIWVDIDSPITHVGQYRYAARFLEGAVSSRAESDVDRTGDER